MPIEYNPITKMPILKMPSIDKEIKKNPLLWIEHLEKIIENQRERIEYQSLQILEIHEYIANNL